MILSQTLLALALVSAQGAGPTFPDKPAESAIPSKIADWHGWAYMGGAPAAWPKIYETSGDWSAIQQQYASVKTTTPTVWRLKVVIFTRIETDARDARGVLREKRGTIESKQLAQVKEAIERLGALATARFDGAVRIVPDIQVESEWMRDSSATPFGPDFAKDYLQARFNGGAYEAEDKVFRGPFHSVLYVLPGSVPGVIPDTVVNDTPVAAVAAVPIGPDGMSLGLDSALRQAWYRQVEYRAKQHGYKGVSEGTGQTAAEAWGIATSLAEDAPEKYQANLGKTLELHPAVADPVDVKVSVLPTTDAQLVADPERGQVLKVVEGSAQRDGGLVLPAKGDGSVLAKVDATPTLTFYAKSSSKDTVAIRLDSSAGKTAWVSLGRDPMLVTPMPGVQVLSEAFLPNGKWQKISVDLKATGLTDVAHLAIEPSPNAKLIGKVQPDLVEYEFDEFKFSTDAPGELAAPVAPDAASEDPEARALFAAQAKAPSPALAALLSDKSELVRLNATTAYIGFKDVSVEPALISNSVDLDPSVAAAALSALMAEGSDVARAIVVRSISVALSDYSKMTAAKLLADTKDPKVAEDITRLIGSKSWQAHLLAVHCLAEIPSQESQLWRLSFLLMEDPAVKLAVTENADPSVDRVASKLLWSAVNEPSDLVRAESYIRLIQSSVEANKSEGYKGVRDDSEYVRKLVVEYLSAHPSEDHRNALRIAIADRSSQVRAAALEGFAALDKGATSEEIANVLDDQNVDVQLALIDFSKKKSVKLPQKTLDAMLASPDTRVSAAAKGL